MNTPADKPDLLTPMPRALLGAVVDQVFDGAIEDASVIEEIYAVIAPVIIAQARAELIAEMEAAPVAYEVQRVYVWVPELFFNLPKAGVIEAKPLAYIPTKEKS